MCEDLSIHRSAAPRIHACRESRIWGFDDLQEFAGTGIWESERVWIYKWSKDAGIRWCEKCCIWAPKDVSFWGCQLAGIWKCEDVWIRRSKDSGSQRSKVNAFNSLLVLSLFRVLLTFLMFHLLLSIFLNLRSQLVSPSPSLSLSFAALPQDCLAVSAELLWNRQTSVRSSVYLRVGLSTSLHAPLVRSIVQPSVCLFVRSPARHSPTCLWARSSVHKAPDLSTRLCEGLLHRQYPSHAAAPSRPLHKQRAWAVNVTVQSSAGQLAAPHGWNT